MFRICVVLMLVSVTAAWHPSSTPFGSVRAPTKFLRMRGGNVPGSPTSAGAVASSAPTAMAGSYGRFSVAGFADRVLNVLYVTDQDLRAVLSRTLATSFWFVVALSVAGSFGFDSKPLVSLVSVAMVTAGFAGKDILNNIFGGMVLLFSKPFKRGDYIRVNSHSGLVVEVTNRYVTLESSGENGKGKNKILLPLAQVATSVIVIEGQ